MKRVAIGRLSRCYSQSAANQEISANLRNVPTSTGAGLFVEHPQFQPLGIHSSLLNITLPSSSILNLRNNSVLAANGDINNMTSTLSVINLWTKPLLYNRISSTTPISMILSNKNTNDSFINLELDVNDQWIVFNTNDIVAWYGESLVIKPNNFNGVKVTSNDENSNLILSGEGQLFTLKLDQEESILLEPSSIVGFNSKDLKGRFKTLKNESKLIDIELPNFGLLSKLKTMYNSLYRSLQAPRVENEKIAEPNEPSKFSESTKVGEWLSVKYNNFKLREQLFYEIKGPATIILKNVHKSHSRIFTNDQLSHIYKQLE